MKLLSVAQLILCLCGSSANALRNPFLRVDGQHTYAYTAFGEVHGTKLQFALLAIDGLCYQVRQGDSVAGHLILAITRNEITIRDARGKELKIFQQIKALQLR